MTLQPEIVSPPSFKGHTDLAQSLSIVLTGNPNSGKTTLFNRLTGLRAKTSNFPGTTVEARTASTTRQGQPLKWVDLPGLYGLTGDTDEERVATGYLRNLKDSPNATLVVLVVDATRLARSLFLAAQIREIASDVVILLNMSDVAAREGLKIDTHALGLDLDARVFAVSARTGLGLSAFETWLDDWVRRQGSSCAPVLTCTQICPRSQGCPYRARFDWAQSLSNKVSKKPGTPSPRHLWTERVDAIITHPAIGLILFVGAMALLFQALFWLAQIPMEWIDGIFSSLQGAVSSWLPDGFAKDFLVDGLITGIGGVLIFLPQIVILFFLISLMEDTGYLARAAFVADRWMGRVGLPGKAFIPILSAHACAIPAIMSTRSIENARDRLITILILPLFTCSARIPIFVMITALLFPQSPGYAGLLFAGAYFLGMLAAFTSAFVLRGCLLKGDPSPLLIELPDYRLPSLRTAVLTSLDRGWLFTKRAGTVIMAITLVLWFATRFPILPEDHPRIEAVGQARAQLEYSIVGRLGETIEPIFAPLGFDGPISIAVLTSFAAREVIVSSLAILYGVSEADAPEHLAARLSAHIPPATALSLLIFSVLAMQCLSTLVVTRRQTGTSKWALLQWVWMSALAYTAALLTYQIASRLL